MHINEIKIMKRRNLGNYEHKEVTMQASLDEKENVTECLEALEGLVHQALTGELKQVAAKIEEPSKQQELPIEEEKAPVKKKVAKKVTKKATKKATPKKEEVVIPTLEEMMELCRATANKLGSGEKVKSLIEEVCKAPSLKDADVSTFIELKKKLEDA